jgi:hypothetical protein
MTSSLNAALPTPTYTTLAAAIESLDSSDTSSSAGPYLNFDTTNQATYREQLATCNTYVSTSINKYALTLTKGYRLEGKRTALKNVETVTKKINFLGQIHTAARMMIIHGTYAATCIGKGENFQAKPLLNAALTILPDGVNPGSNNVKFIMEPPIASFVVNEGSKVSEVEQVTLKPEEVIYVALNPYDTVQEDILDRKTRGMYGQSPLTPLTPTIKALLDINKGQTEFYKKYGNGYRYYRFTILEELVKNGQMEPAVAQTLIDAWMENNKGFSANEDLVTYGIEVNRIDASGSLDVMQFKNALETEIMVGLYQSPLTMGASYQTTYASSYMVEEDRMLVLENNQTILENVAQQMLNKLLLSMSYKEDSVTIHFDDLSKMKLEPQLITDLANSGWINRKMLLDYLGMVYVEDDTSTPALPVPTQTEE